MKKLFTIFILTSVALGLLSCNSRKESVAAEGIKDGAITVRIATADETKAALMSGTVDQQINKVQVFVFDEEDKLETDYYWEPDATSGYVEKTIATFKGQKTVYAVINHARIVLPKDYPLTTFENETNSSILSNLSENTYDNSTSKSNLVMSGKNTILVSEYNKNKTPGASAQVLNIYVKRLAAMVLLEKISVDFRGTSLEGATFSVKQLYLRNVVGVCRLGMTGNAGTAAAAASVSPIALDAAHNTVGNWYNQGSLATATGPAITFENLNASATVAGSATTLNRCLFAYPNKTDADSNSSAFGPRHTRVVMKANIQKTGVIDSESEGDCWYVFDLPVLEANNIYRIKNITITMFGAPADDDSLDNDPGRITPSITVSEWADEVELEYDL